jgi:hypothetical protein
MNHSARKRRGPITLFCESRTFRWAVVALIAPPVLYVASFGPACWISSHTGRGADVVSIVFQPVFSVWWKGPKPFDRLIATYATAFAAKRWTIADSARYQWGEY